MRFKSSVGHCWHNFYLCGLTIYVAKIFNIHGGVQFSYVILALLSTGLHNHFFSCQFTDCLIRVIVCLCGFIFLLWSYCMYCMQETSGSVVQWDERQTGHTLSTAPCPAINQQHPIPSSVRQPEMLSHKHKDRHTVGLFSILLNHCLRLQGWQCPRWRENLFASRSHSC